MDHGHIARDAVYAEARVNPDATLDIAVILGAMHADHDDDTDSTRDRRMHATLQKLGRLLDGLYAIDHNWPHGRGVAMGRYEGNVDYAGGAYFFATLGAAGFCLLAASAASEGSP